MGLVLETNAVYDCEKGEIPVNFWRGFSESVTRAQNIDSL